MKLHLLSYLSFLFLVFSCQKAPLVQHNESTLSFLEGVQLKNNRLHFPTFKALAKAQKALHQKEPLSLENWYKKYNFKSIQELYFEVNEAFSKVKTEQEYSLFLNQYKTSLYIDPAHSISVNGYYPFLAPILNTNGEIYVGTALLKYTNTHKITILDGSEQKLNQALHTLKTNEQEGILVEKLNFNDSNIAHARGCVEHLVWQDCYYGTHERIWGRYEVVSYLPTFDLTRHTIYDPLPYECRFIVLIKSEYKGFLDFWYLNRTNISWSVGWKAVSKDGSLPSLAHGTGWTSYNVSIINYSFSVTNTMPPIFIRRIDLDKKKHIFDYCYTNLTTAHISCSENCH